MTTGSVGPQGRRQRSDGAKTHAAILETATRLASVEGIYGLTLGRLAQELGVSKSGLYAHFGSKEQLQRETIDAAIATFDREVAGLALQAPEGMRRLERFLDAYFSYLEGGVFPGGCFFASLLAEMDARPGAIQDIVKSLERTFQDELAAMVREAQENGEMEERLDARQLAFELYASLALSNFHFVLFRDAEVLERGRRATRGMLDRARRQAGHGGGAAGRRHRRHR